MFLSHEATKASRVKSKKVYILNHHSLNIDIKLLIRYHSSTFLILISFRMCSSSSSSLLYMASNYQPQPGGDIAIFGHSIEMCAKVCLGVSPPWSQRLWICGVAVVVEDEFLEFQ